MTIRTVTVSGVTAVNFNPDGKNRFFYTDERFCWVRNYSETDMHASLDSDCVADAEGTVSIPAGEAGMLEIDKNNVVYLNGSGSAMVRTQDFPDCPFKANGRGGGKLLHYLGVTTTPLTDGASTNPITINDESVTAKEADWVVYNSKDFIFNGTVWQEVGDLSNYYTKSETDTLLNAKANAADVYTKTQADDKFVAKTDLHISDAPTSAEINEAINTIWG